MAVRIVPVIMSGGSGTRLWPLSRAAHPKQLHPLVTELSMVQETARRVAATSKDFKFEAPIIVLNESQYIRARGQLDELGCVPACYVVEPVGRNTAPVAAVAAELVRRELGDDVLVLLLPADHHIRDIEGFHQAIAHGAALAAQGQLVTFGIEPAGPETGYGYIRRGEPVSAGFHVSAFTEKPDVETAKTFLASGEYYWNAGIFLFGAGALLAELELYCSEVARCSLAAVSGAEMTGTKLTLDLAAFEACPSISFDYAVMERTSRAVVVPADIGWSDVGSWDALWSISDKDEHGNASRGNVSIHASENSFVISDGAKVAIHGVKDLIVVATGDAVLVIHRDDAQGVKKIVDALKEAGHDDLL
ncbi:mannose-1-phosphate guanylyltransferase/mannose-6-phosphate isomerase [uncultured Maricaulis sp.]|uniref:mannose-1-phosphate guanylyltransferase/mannose-6-phosphate isomerase n=1 Tax=uncultured Maricaulis sp. TaxID=174710 RepID=UPI0030D7ED82